MAGINSRPESVKADILGSTGAWARSGLLILKLKTNPDIQGLTESDFTRVKTLMLKSDPFHAPKISPDERFRLVSTRTIPSCKTAPTRPPISKTAETGNSKLACKVTEIVLMAPGKKLDCPISASSHSGFIMYSGAAAPSTPAASDLLLFTSRGLICSGPVTETVSTGDCWGMGGFMISVVKV